MYNSTYTHSGTENDYFCRLAALAAGRPAIAGHYSWIFEQESPPVWELLFEVNLGKLR
jgi:hypothetical protein